MYIDNEKEKHPQDINAALRELDHLDTAVKIKEKEKEKKETSRLPPAQGFHTGNWLYSSSYPIGGDRAYTGMI